MVSDSYNGCSISAPLPPHVSDSTCTDPEHESWSCGESKPTFQWEKQRPREGRDIQAVR